MRRSMPTTLALALAASACAPAYQEDGYLVHEDARYEAVRDPALLFDVEGARDAELAVDSEALGLERDYLRYRILAGERYLTVHDQPDPVFRLPPGTYRVAFQPIRMSTFVTGTRVRYGTPAVLEVVLEEHDRVVVMLEDGPGEGIELRVVRRPLAGAGSGGAR